MNQKGANMRIKKAPKGVISTGWLLMKRQDNWHRQSYSRIIERPAVRRTHKRHKAAADGCIPNYNLITTTFPTWQKAAAMAAD